MPEPVLKMTIDSLREIVPADTATATRQNKRRLPERQIRLRLRRLRASRDHFFVRDGDRAAARASQDFQHQEIADGFRNAQT